MSELLNNEQQQQAKIISRIIWLFKNKNNSQLTFCLVL